MRGHLLHNYLDSIAVRSEEENMRDDELGRAFLDCSARPYCDWRPGIRADHVYQSIAIPCKSKHAAIQKQTARAAVKLAFRRVKQLHVQARQVTLA